MIDPTNPAWIEVRDLCREGVRHASRTLEQPGLDPITTEYERGMIYAFRAVLALAEVEVSHPPIETQPEY